MSLPFYQVCWIKHVYLNNLLFFIGKLHTRFISVLNEIFFGRLKFLGEKQSLNLSSTVQAVHSWLSFFSTRTCIIHLESLQDFLEIFSLCIYLIRTKAGVSEDTAIANNSVGTVVSRDRTCKL